MLEPPYMRLSAVIPLSPQPRPTVSVAAYCYTIGGIAGRLADFLLKDNLGIQYVYVDPALSRRSGDLIYAQKMLAILAEACKHPRNPRLQLTYDFVESDPSNDWVVTPIRSSLAVLTNEPEIARRSPDVIMADEFQPEMIENLEGATDVLTAYKATELNSRNGWRLGLRLMMFPHHPQRTLDALSHAEGDSELKQGCGKVLYGAGVINR